ncbi:hypothetical protein COCOR_06661 [Corallococcus coralloides DSM 2259]|uniref:Lipoprotein n=1 Tax=Corallococcus coralloides (strain ATCC 25202 / DSM 2259 / NBRC 100086 / M2) TaxID=1144275 RepID=H8MXP3_CORCM|nr:hypothetical protein [Corallococcus coralloides]AFE07046.1 hypothetical protein COCOR_06661 [Corallococcus coralloides DSM 2259]
MRALLCGLTMMLLGGSSAWAKDDLRPAHQRFTKPEQVREWQQFCRKTSDFDLKAGPDTLNSYLVSLGKEGWELVLVDTQVGMVCFKRPAS